MSSLTRHYVRVRGESIVAWSQDAHPDLNAIRDDAKKAIQLWFVDAFTAKAHPRLAWGNRWNAKDPEHTRYSIPHLISRAQVLSLRDDLDLDTKHGAITLACNLHNVMIGVSDTDYHAGLTFVPRSVWLLTDPTFGVRSQSAISVQNGLLEDWRVKVISSGWCFWKEVEPQQAFFGPLWASVMDKSLRVQANANQCYTTWHDTTWLTELRPLFGKDKCLLTDENRLYILSYMHALHIHGAKYAWGQLPPSDALKVVKLCEDALLHVLVKGPLEDQASVFAGALAWLPLTWYADKCAIQASNASTLATRIKGVLEQKNVALRDTTIVALYERLACVEPNNEEARWAVKSLDAKTAFGKSIANTRLNALRKGYVTIQEEEEGDDDATA